MPIIQCFLDRSIKSSWKNEVLIANKLVDEIGVDEKDLTIQFIQGVSVAGRQYGVLVVMYLPSVWTQGGIERIQLIVQITLCRHLNVEPSGLFLITQVIDSGHVVCDGRIEKW